MDTRNDWMDPNDIDGISELTTFSLEQIADQFVSYTSSINRKKLIYSESIQTELIERYKVLDNELKKPGVADIAIYSTMEEIASDIAIYFFNQDKIQHAATYYLNTIHWLEKIDCDSSELRKLIKYALDLVECYTLLAQPNLALKACHFAIKVFEHIPFMEKTHLEQNIKDPRKQIGDFFNYYQKISSTPSHFKSAAFINVKKLFIQAFETDDIENLLSDLNLSFDQENCNHLTDLLESMTTDHYKQQPQIDIPYALEFSIDETRNQIAQLNLMLATHEVEGDKENVNDTINQMLRLYGLLGEKSEDDLANMKLLKQKMTPSETFRFFFTPPIISTPSSSPKMDLTT